VSALAQAAGLTALQHSEDALAILDALREQRDRILVALSRFARVTAYPSHSNFVLFRTERDAADVWQGLLDRGVLVRDFTKTIPGCLRVNAGTPEETEAFLNAMKEVL
jgi:histidinol-phosphate aminotransferase